MYLICLMVSLFISTIRHWVLPKVIPGKNNSLGIKCSMCQLYRNQLNLLRSYRYNNLLTLIDNVFLILTSTHILWNIGDWIIAKIGLHDCQILDLMKLILDHEFHNVSKLFGELICNFIYPLSICRIMIDVVIATRASSISTVLLHKRWMSHGTWHS